MLIRFAKNNSAKQGLLLLLLSLCLWSKFFMETGFGELRVYALWLLVLMESAFAAFCIAKHKLSKNSLFIGLVYLVCRTVFGFATGTTGTTGVPVPASGLTAPDPLGLSTATCVPFLLLAACYYFLKMYEAEFSLPALLNGTVLWSTAALLLPELVYTLPGIFLILLVYAANRGRIWGVALLGMSLPFAAVGVWDFLNEATLLTAWFTRIPALGLRLPFPPDGLPFYFALSTLLPAVFGWFYLKQNPIEGEILERKRAAAIAAVFIYFLLFFCVVIADPTVTTIPLLLPVAYLFGDYFSRKKETLLSEGLFLLFVILGVLSVWL